MPSILKSLHGDVRADAIEPPASEEDVEQLQAFAAARGLRAPVDYLEIVREATEAELLIGGRGYLRIWSPAGVLEMNEAYGIQARLPAGLALGDDEGGNALVSWQKVEQGGLYLIPFGALDLSEGTYLAPSLRALLVEGVGREFIHPVEG